MKRILSVALAVVAVGALAGVALAQGPGWGPGHGMMGPGYGMMGQGYGMGPGYMMGPGYGHMWGGQRGPGGPGTCPGWQAGATPGVAPQEQITEEKAKELVAEYAGKYYPGFTVERVVPFTGRFSTMYQAELKGPKGETRFFHVNPWGSIRPIGGPIAAN